MLALHRAAIAEMAAEDLHDILRLRGDVFVVEQECAYADIDGLDADPATEHLWYRDEDGTLLACLRVTPELGGGSRIGRVATRPAARGRRLAAGLLEEALGFAARPVALGAQAHLSDWYGSFGFRQVGPTYDDDGIDHVPMQLD